MFASSFMALWKADLDVAYRRRRGERVSTDLALTSGEFDRIDDLFFVVDDFDEEPDLYPQYIGESELRERVRRWRIA